MVELNHFKMSREEQADRQTGRATSASSKNKGKNFIAFTRTDVLHRDTFCPIINYLLIVYLSVQGRSVSYCLWPSQVLHHTFSYSSRVFLHAIISALYCLVFLFSYFWNCKVFFLCCWIEMFYCQLIPFPEYVLMTFWLLPLHLGANQKLLISKSNYSCFQNKSNIFSFAWLSQNYTAIYYILFGLLVNISYYWFKKYFTCLITSVQFLVYQVLGSD